MKLFIRTPDKIRIPVASPDNATYIQLKIQICEELAERGFQFEHGKVILTLNGKDPLQLSDNDSIYSLYSAGVVSGDTLIMKVCEGGASVAPSGVKDSSSGGLPKDSSSGCPPKVLSKEDVSGECSRASVNLREGAKVVPPEAEIPQTLTHMINSQQAVAELSTCDATFIVVHHLFIKYGFIPLDSASGMGEEEKFNKMPAGWKEQGKYRVLYNYTVYGTVCEVNAIEMGKTLTVLCNIEAMEEPRVITIRPAEYITLAGKDVIYNKMLELTNQINGLAQQLSVEIRHDLGIPGGHILSIPLSLLVDILLHLPIKTVLNLIETCKALKQMLDDSDIWKRLLLRDFSEQSVRVDRLILEDRTQRVNWRTEYKGCYNTKQQNQKSEHQDPYMRNKLPKDLFMFPFNNPEGTDPFGRRNQEDSDSDDEPYFPSGAMGGPRDLFPGGMVPGQRPRPRVPQPRRDPNYPGMGPHMGADDFYPLRIATYIIRRGRGRGGRGGGNPFGFM